MRAAITTLALLLTGCASGYSQFYRSYPFATPQAISQTRSGPPPENPALAHASGNPADVFATYGRQGYAAIGYSSFNSGRRESYAAALKQGSKVGADLVVVFDPTYEGSVTSSIPITTPTSTTAVTTGTATAFGPAGTATVEGNATTTTYGTRTTYVPFTINRYSYGAVYFIKRHNVLGVGDRETNDDERRALQSNKGVYITNVVDESPAERADILVGDIVIAVDGQPVFGVQGLNDLLGPKKGMTVTLTVERDGRAIEKAVQLGN